MSKIYYLSSNALELVKNINIGGVLKQNNCYKDTI